MCPLCESGMLRLSTKRRAPVFAPVVFRALLACRLKVNVDVTKCSCGQHAYELALWLRKECFFPLPGLPAEAAAKNLHR